MSVAWRATAAKIAENAPKVCAMVTGVEAATACSNRTWRTRSSCATIVFLWYHATSSGKWRWVKIPAWRQTPTASQRTSSGSGQGMTKQGLTAPLMSSASVWTNVIEPTSKLGTAKNRRPPRAGWTSGASQSISGQAMSVRV